MLSELRIKNFALIEDQLVSFANGLNVISGETGAGKSTVMQALEIVLGGKPKNQLIRSGAEAFEVEALFDLTQLPASVRSELPEIARGQELLVSRNFNLAGKGRVLINGKLGSVTLLSEIVGKIVHICGQGQQTRLTDSRYHLDLIDEYANNAELLSQYGSLYQAWQTLSQKEKNLASDSQTVERRRIELEDFIGELTSLSLTPETRITLERELRTLENAQELLALLQECEQSLNSPGALFDSLKILRVNVQKLAKFLDAGTPLVADLEKGRETLEGVSFALGQFGKDAEPNPERLEDLQENLSKISRLERKYRTDVAGLCEMLAAAQAELTALESPPSLEALRAEIKLAEQAALTSAKKLSKRRRECAEKFSDEVERELAELNMKAAKIRVDLNERELGPHGQELGVFMFQPNPGEGYKLLSEIASGGELSRILLVLKKVLRDRSGVNVLVFDEVDSGMSGAHARAVGEKLYELAKLSQVICITHLPQVASLADHHLVASKVEGKRTHTTIRPVSKGERVDEVARMISGFEITEASRASARELLAAQVFAQKPRAKQGY